MQGLEKGMLPIGPGVAEDTCRRRVTNRISNPVDPLAVGFHLQLLKKGWKQAQTLGIGHDGPDRPVERIAIKDMGKRQLDREVDREAGCLKMGIHRRRPVEQGPEHGGTQGNGAG